jgi:hypothetical protein
MYESEFVKEKPMKYNDALIRTAIATFAGMYPVRGEAESAQSIAVEAWMAAKEFMSINPDMYEKDTAKGAGRLNLTESQKKLFLEILEENDPAYSFAEMYRSRGEPLPEWLTRKLEEKAKTKPAG